MSLIISVSGLRGIVGESLTPDVATTYIAAFASGLPEGSTVLVGRDGRQTGPMIRSAVIAALSASGCNVVDVDVAATPTLGVLVQARGAQAAVQITASHNPPPYNGIKLFGEDGRVLSADRGAAIRDAYLSGKKRYVPFDRIGGITRDTDPHGPHLEAVLETIDPLVVRAAAPRVLVDSNHGSGGTLARRLLESLGCEVVVLGETPDGQFAHVPEPTAENLQDVGAKIVSEKCVVGFCQDPDADRLALIDETGRYIGEEKTLAICVDRILADSETRGPIVINGATSGMSEVIAAGHHVGCHRSAVGEANVADRMIEVGAAYGGEGNGGPIDPRVGYVRDSFVGMAQVLEWMIRSGRPLSQIADELPVRDIYKAKVAMSADALPEALEKLAEHFSDAQPETGDGLRLAWPNAWLLVRGSNTEPIVRFIAEAETMEEAKRLCDVAESIVV